jgi:hypothetical protein
MSALVLDAGALVAVDRGNRAMMARLQAARQAGLELRSTGPVITQVWRDPVGRQANLARLLKSVDVIAVDERLGKLAGVPLGRTESNDAVDAGVVAAAQTGDRIITSDSGDIHPLVSASGRSIFVIPC